MVVRFNVCTAETGKLRMELAVHLFPLIEKVRNRIFFILPLVSHRIRCGYLLQIYQKKSQQFKSGSQTALQNVDFSGYLHNET